MRPIDADTLYDKAEAWYKGAPTPYRKIYRSFVDIIADTPTIAPPPNDPLTLGELREMDGEPVYVTGTFTDCRGERPGAWALVDVKQKMCRVHGGGLAIFENCGKHWLAYRRKPEELT